MGQFPVTNAEWALFMKAGGYEDERWWVTEEDKAWRRGDLGSEGTKQTYREFRKARQADFDSWRASRSDLTLADIDILQGMIRMTDGEFEAQLNTRYPAGRQAQPSKWNDDAFNNSSQPVVGVSWYEARAYCAWLSTQTDQTFRLPTEAEWEAAARGREGRRFAYGNDFDATRCNIFETHIRRTTPIGVFPGGETLDTRLIDMTGNVWDWTSSLFKQYPYDPADGRENPITGNGGRVVRGGSWDCSPNLTRAAFRDHLTPDGRNDGQGFRVACSSHMRISVTGIPPTIQEIGAKPS
jgi:formylglycine-generating enzyme required for sulfatase activity